MRNRHIHNYKAETSETHFQKWTKEIENKYIRDFDDT